MTEPLSDKERESINILSLVDPKTASESERQVRGWIMAYEATVKDRDDRIAALEAELARLRPLAEAVEGMSVNDTLCHLRDETWLAFVSDSDGGDAKVAFGPTPLSALRAAKEAP